MTDFGRHNATHIQGRYVDPALIAANRVLSYDSANEKLIYSDQYPLIVTPETIEASVWTTDPYRLDNSIDNDPDTVTGTGSKALGGAGTFGKITCVMATPGVFLLGLKVGIWSTANAVSVRLQTRPNGINYRYAAWDFCVNQTSTTERIVNSQGGFVTGDRFALDFYLNGAATGYAKLYEIWLHQLQ